MARSTERALDELLVLEVQDGSVEALASLIRRWQPRLYRHALRHTQLHDLAEDVVQESWIAVARGLSRLDDPACFPRWIYQIVSRKSADAIRDRARRRKLADRLTLERGSEPGPSNTPHDDDVGRLRIALGALSNDRRDLLSLYYSDGLSVAEIADILKIPAGTVKSRLHHARQELKEHFERSTT